MLKRTFNFIEFFHGKEMKKIVKVILVLFIFQIQIFLFAKDEENKYSIYFKDAVQKFHLSSNTGEDAGAAEAEKKIKNKKVGKAILVNWSLILADSINYWSKYTKWLEDWQFRLTWKDQKRRFFTTEAIKFDSNPFLTNWTHGVSGAAFFNIARYYRLNIPESLLFELSSSLSWEYITEWREVISINDVFFSGLGGLPIGEPLYQYSKYLLSRKGVVPKIAGYIINPIFALNDLIGQKKWRNHFREEYQNAPTVEISAGFEKSRYLHNKESNLNLTHLGLSSTFLNVPQFSRNKGKKYSEKLNKTFYTSVSLDLSLSSEGVEEYIFETEVVLFGKAEKREKTGKRGKIKSNKLFYGFSSGFELFKKRSIVDYDKGEYHYDFTAGEQPPQPTEFKDKLAVINLAGPVFYYRTDSGRLTTELKLNGYLNFSLVTSNALNKYTENNDLFELRRKTTLSYYGYYYAFGYTLKSYASLSAGILRFSGSAKYQRFSSIQGVDRFQNEIGDDSGVHDSRTFLKFTAGLRIPHTPFYISGTLEGNKRFGSFKNTVFSTKEKRTYLELKIHF